MKKIILVLTSILLVSLNSCYNSQNATVRINLGNIPIAKNVEKKSFLGQIFSLFVKDANAQVPVNVHMIYLAAYSGSTLTAKMSISPADINTDQTTGYSIVEFNVPAGDNIKILVVASTQIGETSEAEAIYGASYYGLSPDESLNLKVDETASVSIAMKYISDDLSVFNYDCNTEILTLSSISYAENVLEFSESGEGGWSVVYRGAASEYANPIVSKYYRLHVNFGFINLNSETTSSVYTDIGACMK